MYNSETQHDAAGAPGSGPGKGGGRGVKRDGLAEKGLLGSHHASRLTH
jgi:hypothetical protein